VVRYRNKFEERTAEVLSGLCKYEPITVPYTVNRKYIPDFVGEYNNVQLLFECKGYFRIGDVQKYKAIRDSLAKNQELIFILYEPLKKVRKSGKINMGQWCDKEGIRWFTLENLKDAFTS